MALDVFRKCPHCGSIGYPKLIQAVWTGDDIEVICQCMNCGEEFWIMAEPFSAYR